MARLDLMLFDMIVPPDRHGSMKWHNSATLMTTTKKNQPPRRARTPDCIPHRAKNAMHGRVAVKLLD